MIFSQVLASLTRNDNTFRAKPPEDWRQGRTLFGGLSACLAVVSARIAYPEIPPLRSAQFAFIGPVARGLSLEPRILRAGKSATFITVDGKADADIALRATLVFGATRRSSHFYRALSMPEVSPPGKLADFFDASFAPAFTCQFDGRIAGGARPVSGTDKPELVLWVRHRDHAAPDDVTSIIALGDVAPPAAMTMFTTLAPVSTVNWSIDVFGDRHIGSGWHLVRVEAETVAEGYSSQRMTLWDAAGTPVLAARQTVAIFG
jgi:acyl-CoA thioesterase